MQEPTATGLGDWAFHALTGLLGMLGINLMSRTRKLEIEAKSKSEASLERAELREDIADTRESITRLSDKMDSQHTRIFERLDYIVDHMNGSGKR